MKRMGGAALLAAVLLAGCGGSDKQDVADGAPHFDAAFLMNNDIWREQRKTELLEADGWTSLVGLHWLELKAHYIGSGSTSGIRLAVGPERMGMVSRDGGQVWFTPEPGAALQVQGQPLTKRIAFHSDDDFEPTIISFDDGKGALSLIHRGPRYALRVKHADAPARVLSRGQKQRLGLARALVHDPRVLLLDEPASGLDPQARIDLRLLLRRLAAEGRTILLSSHILSELEEVVDDAVFLVQGSTVSSDRIAEAARRERTWRVRLADRDAVSSVLPVAQALGRDPVHLPVDRRDVLVGFASDGDAAAGLAALVTAGLPVAEFSAATGLLEHTFLDLEGGNR